MDACSKDFFFLPLLYLTFAKKYVQVANVPDLFCLLELSKSINFISITHSLTWISFVLVPCLLSLEAMFQIHPFICWFLTWREWTKCAGEEQLQDISVQDDPRRTALSRTFQSQELSWGSAWATWFPHFLESQTLNLSLLLKVKFSKWDVSAVSESSLGICSLNKRERVWTAGDLFSRLSWVTEVLRTSFILAAWVAKLRGHFNIGLAGLHLWVSLCKYLSCGRSSVCFFAELLEISERFVRLKDTTKLLLALRQTNLVLGKIQWVLW